MSRGLGRSGLLVLMVAVAAAIALLELGVEPVDLTA